MQFPNFTPECRQVLIDSELRVQKLGLSWVTSSEVFFSLLESNHPQLQDFCMTHGLNSAIIREVLKEDTNSSEDEKKTPGSYTGMSTVVKDIIVNSAKTAAHFQKTSIDVFDLFLAILQNEGTNHIRNALAFVGISPSDLEGNINEINKFLAGSQSGNQDIFGPLDGIIEALEGDMDISDGGQEHDVFAQNIPPKRKAKESNTPALDFFGTDLTEEARNGKIDHIIGRDTEIERLVSILNRKTKNNPCLVGEPGVGKTAVVEGLALRIAQSKVPLAMRDKKIIAIDLSSVVAGTKYRGEFESRLKQIIDEASKMENEIVLFIDEIHTIIGAGSGEGSLDAANILKPAMGRGKISVIGATTQNEYSKHIEKDSALERRFQKINVEEPTNDVALSIITGIKEGFEEFHNLNISNEAIKASIDLSTRYITDRYLPDKAIDLIDEACSAKSMTYTHSDDESDAIREKIEKHQKDIDAFVTSGQLHKALKVKEAMHKLEEELTNMKAKRTIPKSKRLIITTKDIQKIVHQMTGVPAANLESEDISRLKKLPKTLKSQIIDQESAIDAIVSSLKRSRTGIGEPNRPIGSFLFLGPTGVGKTELVRVLAREFYGDEKALIKIDMSEFGERSSASKLIGTTAGYVGYDDGGLLTEKVRKSPYSIVLFDEIEKGNFEVFHLLLQILEDGVITDGRGRKINFKNTIIIMTSNIGSEEFGEKSAQIGFSMSNEEEGEIKRDFDKIREKVISSLDDYFAPELINRIDKITVFDALTQKSLKKIVTLQLQKLQERLEGVGMMFEFDTKSVHHITKATFDPKFGARSVRRYIQDHVEDMIADHLINHPKDTQFILTLEKEKIVIKTNKSSFV
ncbi:MAG: ATP-dependent Clp protease ATP-binding subunit [Candidatus Gracilibacteria bacterium]